MGTAPRKTPDVRASRPASGKWLRVFRARRLWHRVAVAGGVFYRVAIKLPWVAAAAVVVLLLVQSLSQRTTAIQAISVPKSLVESGYSPEVAARRLRDALGQLTADSSSQTKLLNFALPGDAPDIIVPTVGLSLDTIAYSIRTFLKSERRRTISGEFIVRDNLLWLRLRMDGAELYSSVTGGPLENPDSLLIEAAPKIVEAIRPFLLGAHYYGIKQPAKALEIAEGIIMSLPQSHEDVAQSYVLKGMALAELQEYPKAIEALGKSIQLDPRLATAYIGLGIVLRDRGAEQEAIAAFRNAITLAPRRADARIHLGYSLLQQGKVEEAIAALREAIRLDPKEPTARMNLGAALGEQGRNDEAIAAYRDAGRLDPKNTQYPYAVGILLQRQGKHDEAIAAFRDALRLDPKSGNASFELAGLLDQQQKHDEAIAVLRALVNARSDALSHYLLAAMFELRGPREEAIAEYREAVRLEPDFLAAREKLDALLREAPAAASK